MKVYTETEPLGSQSLNVLIYGDPGIGKTTLVNTAPNPITLDFDRGAHRATFRKSIVQFDSWQDVVSSKKHIDSLIESHETVVIDTVGTMIECIQFYLLSTQPGLIKNGIKLWGETKKVVNEFIYPLKLSGKNIIFVAHAKEKEEGDYRIKRPLVQGSSYDLLMQICDLVGYYTSVNNIRTLTFDLTDTITAKNCANIQPIKIPDVTQMTGTMSTIIQDTIKALNTKSVAQEVAIEQVVLWQNKAKLAKDPQKLMDELGKGTFEPAVKRAIWSAISTELNSRAYVWNPELKLWGVAS